ncbi:uncharacterized protein LOC123477368 [Daphnia magna]|uniref:uncharacterized protein LOC123477368 n=1 Tax=Daphnia magna TaxID=35525 RepID=UPI001E1BCAD1|nr:uncharacterized protein LOC123477368 [Daphnia magna]
MFRETYVSLENQSPVSQIQASQELLPASPSGSSNLESLDLLTSPSGSQNLHSQDLLASSTGSRNAERQETYCSSDTAKLNSTSVGVQNNLKKAKSKSQDTEDFVDETPQFISCNTTDADVTGLLSSGVSSANASNGGSMNWTNTKKANVSINNGPSYEHLMVMKALQQVIELSKKIDLRIRNIEDKIDRKITPEIEGNNWEGLPLKDVTEFQAFEKKLLSDPQTFDAVVLLVERCGGDTVAEAVTRAWDRITTKECRSACNWCGIKKKGVKKHKISGSKIVDAVHKGVRKTLPDAKDSQLEKETKKRFVRTPEKLKPAKASSSQTSHVGDEEDSD